MIVWYIFSFFISASADVEINITQRILYGENAKIEDFPYYAGLANCGAAILSNVWVLTAAHCVADQNPRFQSYVWVGGETYSNSIKVPYNKIIIHEEYINYKGLPINDVALIGLAMPLKFSAKVNSIQLPNNKPTSTRTVIVGRGRDETGQTSGSLKKLNLMRLSPEQCVRLVSKEMLDYIGRTTVSYLQKTNICTKRENDMPTVCHGDSGSPLVSDNEVVGLASYIGGDCQRSRLGFYVNVQYYVPWIRMHTGL